MAGEKAEIIKQKNSYYNKKWLIKGSGRYSLVIFFQGVGTVYSESVTGSHYVTIN